jgi:hypothetical protein
MTISEGSDGIINKVGSGMVIAALVLLFIALSQPAWRGDQMLTQMRTDCNKVGGVMLEDKGLFGTTYQCSPRYDRGVKQ